MSKVRLMQEYSKLLDTPQWKEFSDRVKARDGRKCKCCGSTKGPLQAHHMQYYVDRVTGKRRLPWLYPLNALTTLCKSCHVKGHQLFTVPTLKI